MVFTPKGLHNIAQGRERSERTLGVRTAPYNRVSPHGPTLKWIDGDAPPIPQGALAALATLGYVV